MSSNASPAEIQPFLLAEISNMFPDVSELTALTPLQGLGIDSLRLFELFVLIENRFGLSLIDGPLPRRALENIEALTAHIAARLTEN